MLDYYAARAEVYEEIYGRPERREELSALHDRVRAAFVGRVVLEPACGTGYWTRTLAEVARCVFAFDAAAEPLAVARAKALPTDRVRFFVGDAHRPDEVVPGEPLDAAFVGCWWSHLPRDGAGAWLGRLTTRLPPGSVVVLVDNRWVPGSSTPLAHTDAAGDTWQERRLGADRFVIRKNVYDDDALRAAAAPWLEDVRLAGGPHFWWLEGRVGEGARRGA